MASIEMIAKRFLPLWVRLPIRYARIARPDGSTFEGDVACQDGRIARIEPNTTFVVLESIDSAGLGTPS